ncbi:MAG: hypothetical protein JWR84_1489 [Caulobacter sp.]|nr:hypothetical protein [Caulobacter sp.]
MDNLFGAAAMPTPDTPLLHNDEARPTEIRAADDAAIAAALASYGSPPQLILQAGKQPLYTPPPVAALDTLNAMKQPDGAFTDDSHVRPGPVRRLLRFLMPLRDL